MCPSRVCSVSVVSEEFENIKNIRNFAPLLKYYPGAIVWLPGGNIPGVVETS